MSPEAAVFLPASFFSGALEAVAGALEAGFLSAALGAISKDLRGLVKKEVEWLIDSVEYELVVVVMRRDAVVRWKLMAKPEDRGVGWVFVAGRVSVLAGY